MQKKIQLPEPDESAKAHSEALVSYIKQQIQSHQGKISFEQYMQLALYAPGLGYYSAGMQKFGKDGDFITAPEISPLFAQVIAIQCQQILSAIKTESGNGDILEFGAGSGKMAADIILELEKRQNLPEFYYILELSADLQQRQQDYLKQQAPHLFDKFRWLNELPAGNFTGVIVANEVIDAMPVKRIKIQQKKCYESFVCIENDRLNYCDFLTDNPEFTPYVEKVNHAINHQKLTPDFTPFDKEHVYYTEVNSYAKQWIKSLANCMQQGAILLIDYGYPEAEYLHPQRNSGTLMCHYRHHSHEEPFFLPGLQDITAHVNFSDIKQAAEKNQLKLNGYTTQAHFLLLGGLEELAQDFDLEDTIKFAETSRQIKKLTLPNEMGELFKVMLLSKNKDFNLPAFQMDMSHKL